MKVVVVVCALVAVVVAAPADIDFLYSIDYHAILDNDARRQATFDCLLDKAPCGDQQLFKDNVIEVALNKCADCNQEQKKKYDIVLKKCRDEHENLYNEFMEKLKSLKM